MSSEKLASFGKVEPKSVADLKLQKACVLDPEADETLTPEEAKNFDHFIFGGILGDHPPKERTRDELTAKLPYPAFNLGKLQMSTDTAVIVTKMIKDGKRLEDLQFQESVEIQISDFESCVLPYKYLVIDGKVLIAPGVVEMLKTQETF